MTAMVRSFFGALALLFALLPVSRPLSATPAESAAAPSSDPFGVLVMAHGGDAAWNANVHAAVATLEARHPVEIAFGMADACSMQEAVTRLEARGVRQIGVVRLFVSGESWLERTEQIFGLREGAPSPTSSASGVAECTQTEGDDHGGHGSHGNAQSAGGQVGHAGHAVAGGVSAAPPMPPHRMAFFRVASKASFTVSREGLMEAPEMGAILVDRARGLSQDARNEDVLILAHGPESDEENERWLGHLRSRAAGLEALGFHSVTVETLREDWPEKRKAIETRVRELVAGAAKEGRRVLVLPFRLSGFGPYARIFEGQAYVADRVGLLPHAAVGEWIARQAEVLAEPVAVGR
jgi:sirohydrochlorin cobaltochelatase